MSDDSWYTKPYPSGRMVGPPLPRPLYPADATSRGKTPSPPGEDVKGIKRTVWRLGRWPGPASAFDTTFSNNFSHGSGPNVVNTGIAGFQRQQGIDPTGWVGEATFNELRAARIPEGLPNAGQPGMDAAAIELLEQYANRIAGGKTVRLKALQKAREQLGYKESPSGTNGNMFGAWYGMNYEPWCAMFVTWCYELSGGSPSFEKGKRYAYCPYVLNDARQGKNGLSITGDPEPGDLVLYDWKRDGLPDHVGLFEEWMTGRSFRAIEGNTSVGNDSNGGECMRRQRDAGSTRIDFVRVAEP